jgi:uncharacterized protein (TIGR03437 family)
VLNAASFIGGGVAPGELVAIFGSNLGPQQIVKASASEQSIPRALSGVRVLFDGTAAPLLYVSDKQIGASIPYGVAGRSTTSMYVEYLGNAATPVNIPVLPTHPGIFSSDSSGFGQAAVLNENFTLNSKYNPAPVGTVLMIFATGEGLTTPDGVDGKIVNWPAPVPKAAIGVTIGGKNASVLYAGGSPSSIAGLMQVNAKIPDDVAPGDNVPLIVTVGGVPSQNRVTVAVSGLGR